MLNKLFIIITIITLISSDRDYETWFYVKVTSTKPTSIINYRPDKSI